MKKLVFITLVSFVTFSAFVGLSCADDDMKALLDCALLSIQNLDASKSKVEKLAELASEYANLGDKKKASELLQKASRLLKQKNVLSEPGSFWQTAKATAVGYAKIGQYDKAAEIAKIADRNWESVSTTLSEDVLQELAIEASKQQDYSKALQITEKISNNICKALALNGIAQQLFLAGETEKANEIFSQAVKIALEKPISDFVLASLANTYARIGQKDKALKILSQAGIISEKTPELIVEEMAISYAAAGAQDRASSMTKQALSWCSTDVGEKEEKCLKRIVILYAKIGQIDEALRISEKIENPDEYICCLAAISDALVVVGQTDKALGVLSKAVDTIKKNRSKFSIDAVAISYAKAGKYKEALFLARFAVSSGQVDALIGIAREFSRSGRTLNPEEREALHNVRREIEKQGDPRYGYDLEVLNWSWTKIAKSYVEVVGRVKNISNQRLSSVVAVVSFYDRKDNLVTYGTSLIEYDPLLPEQISPFKIIDRYNPAMDYARIEFKEFGGELIPTFHPERK